MPPSVVQHDPAEAGGVSPDFERECVEFFAGLIQAFGVPRSLGQIYGLLFASPRALSFTEIAERLDISKGSVSQGLQLLRSLGAIQVVITGEDRRERFVPELALRKLVAGILKEKIEPLLSDGGARMRRLRVHALQAADSQGIKFSRGRVKQIETWRRQMGLILPLLRTLLGSHRP